MGVLVTAFVFWRAWRIVAWAAYSCVAAFALLHSLSGADADVQLVSGLKYYILELRDGEPQLRESFLMRFRNRGEFYRNEVIHYELPSQPYLEYRNWQDGRPVRVQHVGHQMWCILTFPRGREVELRTEAIQRVLARDRERQVDYFEDGVQWGGWRPPIEDYWIVVDLGKMYQEYQNSPAFGMRDADQDGFQRFLDAEAIQVQPEGYERRGSKIWWHLRDVRTPVGHMTIHVEWHPWYRQ